MIYKATLWMLLVTCGLSFKMYDENNPLVFDQNGDINYSDDNYNYLDPVQYGPEILEDPAKNLMLYQLFNSLHNRDDVHLRMHYRPKFGMVENPMASYAHVPFTDLLDLKRAIMKRLSDAPRNAPDDYKANQQQPKLKGKKIRKVGQAVHMPMFCFFKLCTFHPLS